MPWGLCVMLGLSGVAYIVFAFVEPPSMVNHFLRVPGLLALVLPSQHVTRIGRLITGLFILAMTAFTYWKIATYV